MKKQVKLFTPAFSLLFCIEFLYQFGVSVTTPIVSNYAVSIGLSVAVGGFIAGLNAIASLATRPFSGIVTDSVSNKKILLIILTTLFMIASYGCVMNSSAVIICICRAVQGIAFAIKSVLIIWMASSIVQAESIGTGVGWLSVAYVIANMLGPVIGSYVGKNYGYHMSFLVAGILFTLAFFLIFLFKPQNAQNENETPYAMTQSPVIRESRLIGKISLRTFFYPDSLPFSITSGLFTFTLGSTTTLFLLIAESRGIEGASTFFFVQAIVMFASRPIFGRISDIFGVNYAFFPTAIFSLCAMLMLIWANSLSLALLAAVCVALGQNSSYSVLQAESVRGVEKSMLGRAGNTFFIGPDIGMGVGPLIGGIFLQYFGSEALFSFNAVLVVFAILLYSVFSLKKAKSMKQKEY